MGPEVRLTVMPFQERKLKAEMTYIKQFLCHSKAGLLTGWLPAPKQACREAVLMGRKALIYPSASTSNWVDHVSPIFCFNSSPLTSRVTGTDLEWFQAI